MPRIRTIKPEIWASPSFGQLSPGAKLLFIGLITQADDEGRCKGAPVMLAAVLFPYGDYSAQDVDRALEELSKADEADPLIWRYEVAGKPYVWLPQFLEHQKINRPSASRYPPCPEDQLPEGLRGRVLSLRRELG